MPNWLLRLRYTGQTAEKSCSHVEQIEVVTADTDVCRDCVATGDTWPALRMCLICGYVGCCDKSKNQHMRKHCETTGHPLILSLHPREAWVWCYPDAALLDLDSPQLAGKLHPSRD
ncbi:MAG: UBP-type zinc finger domain-containing protein [Caldilineales bacterium]